MKILKRSLNDKWIAGICGGIGTTYDWDPMIVRLVFIFTAIATGLLPLLATYLVAWAILPTNRGPSIYRSIISKPEPGIPVAERKQKQHEGA